MNKKVNEMEYVYAAMLLHSAGKDIDEAMATAVAAPVASAAPAASSGGAADEAAPAEEEAAEEPEEEAGGFEGLGSLFG